MQQGTVDEARPEAQVEVLLELGALDIREKISQGAYTFIILTEDRIIRYLNILLKNSELSKDATVLPYNGVTTINLLKPLVQQIKNISQAAIIVHRDRDYMEPDEVEIWSKEIRSMGAEPFVTRGMDIESYFTDSDYLKLVGSNVEGFDLGVLS